MNKLIKCSIIIIVIIVVSMPSNLFPLLFSYSLKCDMLYLRSAFQLRPKKLAQEFFFCLTLKKFFFVYIFPIHIVYIVMSVMFFKMHYLPYATVLHNRERKRGAGAEDYILRKYIFHRRKWICRWF